MNPGRFILLKIRFNIILLHVYPLLVNVMVISPLLRYAVIDECVFYVVRAEQQ
jgi:hypothetical protein